MSRPIISQSLSGTSISNGSTFKIPANLNLETLTVRNIFLTDSLYTKNSTSSTSSNKLQLTSGSIYNIYNSTNANLKVLKYNNVYFLPDVDLSNIVTLYTDNILNIGILKNPLNLYGSDIYLKATDKIILDGNLLINSNVTVVGNIIGITDLILTGNLQVDTNTLLKGPLQVNSSTHILNTLTVDSSTHILGRLQVDSDAEILGDLQVNSDTYILGKLEVDSSGLIRGSLQVDSSARIIGTLEVDSSAHILGALTVDSSALIKGTLEVNSSSHLIGALTVDSSALIKGALTVDSSALIKGTLEVDSSSHLIGALTVDSTAHILGDLTADQSIILDNKIIRVDPLTNYLMYNANNVVTITPSNILSCSNILVIDPTGRLDTMFEVVGNITCNSIYLTSDINKKKNIREITYEEINNLNNIKSYNFDLKSSNNNNFGFMAHEVSNLYPMLSTGDTVNYIGFIPLLLEKIKILEERIMVLEDYL
jgi:hypothetical protein